MQTRTSSPVIIALFVLFFATAMTAEPGIARATGACENLTTSYSVVGINRGGQRVLVEASRQWCFDDGETDKDDEPDGLTMLVLDKRGRVLRRFDSKPPSYGDLSDLTLGANVKPERMAALKPLKLRLKFVEADTLDLPRCTKSIVSKGLKTSPKEFSSARAKVVLTRKGKRVWSKSLGRVDVGDSGPLAAAEFFAVPGAPKRLLVWSSTGECDGPPPGYFGPDDGGECYEAWTHEFAIIRRPKTLRRCMP